MKKGEKFWCWWASRYIWFSGLPKNKRGEYTFRDICDEIIMVAEKNIKDLRENP